ncbi:hypothetical protein [Kitasatospora sp. NPDC096140]|uniref:hypothetical protein n=1 Tax=Kitasatospora sp. NPDC096140 TaxID=3155425 RepID=UPI00331D0FF6
MLRTARVAGCAAGAVVLALGAVACTGQRGGDAELPFPTVLDPAPTEPGVTLSQPAPASAQWIVNALIGRHLVPEVCPAPSLTDMIVLDDAAGHSRAVVVWLGEGEVTCVAAIRNGGGAALGGQSLASLADQPFATWLTEWDIIAVFPGDAGKVVLKDDVDHVYGPLHQRVVDFGGGRKFTIVEYAYLPRMSGAPAPQPSNPPSARARVCPSDTTQCRPVRYEIRPSTPTPDPSATVSP